MEEIHLRAECFNERGFSNLVVNRTETELRCRTNVRDEATWNIWKELHCMTSRSSLNVVRTSEDDARTVFSQHLKCQFGNKRLKGVRKHYTGCTFQMRVHIKRVTASKLKNDKQLRTHPCFITIRGTHNHADRPESLKELPVLPGVKEDFEEYFKRGMGVAAARRYHQLKMDLSDDYRTDRARTDTNPSLRCIQYMFDKWYASAAGGYTDENMFEALDKFAAKSKSVIEVGRRGTDSFCVALVTPFMKRVHGLREASEVVLVDTMAPVDQMNTTVVPFHCPSPAGVLPLGVVFCSSQDESLLTTGFRLLQKAMGATAFGGRGHPEAFVTENFYAKKKALRRIWPMATQYLSISHVLQQVWKWLQDKHEISKERREALLGVVRSLACAESPEQFVAILGGLNVKHDGFASYLEDLLKSRNEWANAFCHGASHASHRTSNHSAAILCIMKDIAQSRCRTRTGCELVIIMDDIYNGFMVHRLIDNALDLRQSKRLAPPSVPDSAITRIDEHKFRVTSDADPPVTYDVVLDLGVCSCKEGETGGSCAHQTACAHLAMVTLPDTFVRTSENRRWLMCVAVGEDKAPDLTFFSDFRARESPRVQEDLPTSSDTDTTCAGLIVPAVPYTAAPLWNEDDLEADQPSPQPDAAEVSRPVIRSNPADEAAGPAVSDTAAPLWDEDDLEADQPSPQSDAVEEVTRPATRSNLADEAAAPSLQASNPVHEAPGPVPQASVPESRQRPSDHLVGGFLVALARTIEQFGDCLTGEALQKATERVAKITNSAQLNDWLASVGPGAEFPRSGAAECGIAEGNHLTPVDQRLQDQGVSDLMDGDPPGQAAKRRRCLGEGVATNGTNAESHSAGRIGVQNFEAMR